MGNRMHWYHCWQVDACVEMQQTRPVNSYNWAPLLQRWIQVPEYQTLLSCLLLGNSLCPYVEVLTTLKWSRQLLGFTFGDVVTQALHASVAASDPPRSHRLNVKYCRSEWIVLWRFKAHVFGCNRYAVCLPSEQTWILMILNKWEDKVNFWSSTRRFMSF